MNAIEFCYWLQGAIELDRAEDGFDKNQMDVIKAHLNLVFTNVTNPPKPNPLSQYIIPQKTSNPHPGVPVNDYNLYCTNENKIC